MSTGHDTPETGPVPGLPETQRERRGHPFYPAPGERLPALYSTEPTPVPDKLIVAHYFIGACDWWVAEYDPEDGRAFGFACLGDPQGAEWGYVDLAELEPICVQGGLAVVERDMHWTPKTFKEIWPRGERA